MEKEPDIRRKKRIRIMKTEIKMDRNEILLIKGQKHAAKGKRTRGRIERKEIGTKEIAGTGKRKSRNLKTDHPSPLPEEFVMVPEYITVFRGTSKMEVVM